MGVEDLYQRKYTDQKLAQKCGVNSKQSLNPGYVVNLLPKKENSKFIAFLYSRTRAGTISLIKCAQNVTRWEREKMGEGEKGKSAGK